MIEVIIKFLLAYLIGTLMGGQIIGWLRGGVDLRQQGSGNVGTTNALRTQGKAFAAGVLLIDVLKGVLAVLLVPMLAWPWAQAETWPVEWQSYVCGVGVALGHCYPVSYGFKGGKGVATLAGVFATLLTPALPWVLSAFVIVTILSGYVGLASVSAAIAALFYITCIDARGLYSAVGAFTLAMALLVIWKHRMNLIKTLRGEESRFEKARLLHRWLSR